MSAQVNYFRIGLFVTIGFFLGGGSLVLFNIQDVFADGFVIETYLDESVEGLDVGSPVKYRGVKIGKVDEIDFVRNLYRDVISDDQLGLGSYVVVRVQLEPQVFEGESYESAFQLLQREAEAGLRAILTPKGFTGTAYLEVDYRPPDQYPVPEIDWQPRQLYLPSATSTLRRFALGLDELLSKLVDTDIDTTFDKLAELLASIRLTTDRVSELLHDPTVESIPANVAGMVEATRGLVEQLGSQAGETLTSLREGARELTELGGKVNTVLDSPEMAQGLEDLSASATHIRSASSDVADTLSAIRKSLHRIDFMLSGQQPDLEALVANLRVVSEHLMRLTELAEEYPSLLLFGEPPKRAKQ